MEAQDSFHLCPYQAYILCHHCKINFLILPILGFLVKRMAAYVVSFLRGYAEKNAWARRIFSVPTRLKFHRISRICKSELCQYISDLEILLERILYFLMNFLV